MHNTFLKTTLTFLSTSLHNMDSRVSKKKRYTEVWQLRRRGLVVFSRNRHERQDLEHDVGPQLSRDVCRERPSESNKDGDATKAGSRPKRQTRSRMMIRQCKPREIWEPNVSGRFDDGKLFERETGKLCSPVLRGSSDHARHDDSSSSRHNNGIVPSLTGMVVCGGNFHDVPRHNVETLHRPQEADQLS